MIQPNLLLMTDSYKVSHWKQYPPKTTGVFSFLESRGGKFPATTFFGLTYILEKYFTGTVVTRAKIEEAADFFTDHFGNEDLFNRSGWEHILEAHDGRLPVIIKAVPEGSTIPTGNVLLTIENTDPLVPWLVNYLETILVQVWYPTTVCTQSREMKKLIRDAMLVSCDNLDGLPFKLHDFGYRGSTSYESAGIGGCAHLVNFMGTDTMAALEVARNHYGAIMAGYSIPAAEHSTITAWGKDHEREAYENMLTSYPTGLVAVVSDSYNIYDAVEQIWGNELHDKVIARDGTVVIRPDSGDPSKVIRQLLQSLGSNYGVTRNTKGYMVLNPKVRLIQGDGIDFEMLRKIIADLLASGWSMDNIAFGSGGGLLQKMDRDTCRFAMKCSAVEIDGVWHDVMKSPVGDTTKLSKPGRLILTQEQDGTYATRRAGEGENILRTVFLNGWLESEEILQTIRARAAL
jgi:nicotinamide phosphoribosyltransferase